MLLLLFAFAFCDDPDDPPAPREPVPTAQQLYYQRHPLSSFIHFSMNTFTGSEVGDPSIDPNVFNPTDLDTDQWISTLKKAGFDRVLFTAKHHDGFCLWKTQTTNYSIENSKKFQEKYPGGDVVKMVADSCKKYNLNLGIYLSPWDRHAPEYGTDAYNDVYKAQLRELLTNYGPIVEIWMDNYRDDSVEKRRQKYDFLGYFSLIKELQPDCIVASPYASDIRWIGNERGIAGELCWYTINSTYVREYFEENHKIPNDYQKVGDVNGDVYAPAEVDFTIQKAGWFWSSDKEQVKTIDELTQIYFDSIGRGQIFLMNVPPNDQGKFPQKYVDRVLEFGRAINRSFGRNYANQSMAVSATAVRNRNPRYDPKNLFYIDNPELYWSMNDGMLTGYVWFDFVKTIIFDAVSVVEHMELGQRVSKFTIDYEQNGFWKTFASGLTIGELRLFRSKPISAQKLYIKIEDSEAVLAIESWGLYKLQDGFELGQFIPTRIFESKNVHFEGDWSIDGENNVTSKVGASATSKFHGSYCSVVGPLDPEYGTMEIYVDGTLRGTVNVSHEYHRDRRELFRIGDLENGDHELKVVCASKKIGVYHLYYLDNYEIGLFEIASRDYKVVKGEEVEIEIKRIGGSKTTVQVLVKTDFFTAKNNKHFVPFNEVVTFEENEVSKFVKIQTLNYAEEEDLIFNVVIDEATLGSEVGFNYSTMVTISGSETPKPDDDDKETKIFFIAGICGAATMAVIITILIVFQCMRREKKEYNFLSKNSQDFLSKDSMNKYNY
ncbi:calx-beta domain-containing protein [Tritrichomonas foetus]|uniref:alpha-L-fucosidase n=1 Tax=Tritrichomonas foetus TaxID=1144522 RepID=A0A1J4KEW8_9EUKA|nr:calx-beta domain-containing protein [Tritrichomonas foetus]|eukprot:OHT10001.1 calx-beta domain-containing protein [Tritrichomonas foetus]